MPDSGGGMGPFCPARLRSAPAPSARRRGGLCCAKPFTERGQYYHGVLGDESTPLWKRPPGRAVLFDNASHKPNTQPAARAADELLSTLADAGWSVETLRAERDGFKESLERLERESPSLILAFGGGGTVAASAQVAAKVDASMLPIPGGTMNLSAKDAGAFGDLDTLPRRAMLGHALRVDYAEVNGIAFLHSATIGLIPWIGVHRERFRELPLRDRWRAIARAARAAAARDALDVRFESDRGSAEAKTLCAVIANNPLNRHADIDFGRASLDGGVLAIYLSTHRGTIGRLLLLLSLATGQLELDRRFRKAAVRTLTIEGGGGPIMVSVDGEIMRFKPPIEFSQHRQGLTMLIPAPPEAS